MYVRVLSAFLQTVHCPADSAELRLAKSNDVIADSHEINEGGANYKHSLLAAKSRGITLSLVVGGPGGLVKLGMAQKTCNRIHEQ